MIYNEDIKCFFRVVELGDFSKAAASMEISQPTLTRRIKRLEDALECELFFRAKKGEKANLTHLGNEYYKLTKELSDVIEEKTALFQKLKRREQTTLRIGVLESNSMVMCTKALKNINELHPEVNFSIQEMDESDLQDGVRTGLLDFAFCMNITDENITSKKVGQLAICLIARKDHHLAGKNTVSIIDFQNEPLIVGQNYDGASTIRSWFSKNSLSQNIIARFSQPNNGLIMVEAGLGIMLAPSNLYSVKSNPLLTEIPLNKNYTHNIYVIWDKDLVLTDYHKLFLDSL